MNATGPEPLRGPRARAPSLPAYLPLQRSPAEEGTPSARFPRVALGPAAPDITHALRRPEGAGRAPAAPVAAVSGTRRTPLCCGARPACLEDVQVQADGLLLTNH